MNLSARQMCVLSANNKVHFPDEFMCILALLNNTWYKLLGELLLGHPMLMIVTHVENCMESDSLLQSLLCLCFFLKINIGYRDFPFFVVASLR